MHCRCTLDFWCIISCYTNCFVGYHFTCWNTNVGYTQLIIPRCACASEVYGSLKVCVLCLSVYGCCSGYTVAARSLLRASRGIKSCFLTDKASFSSYGLLRLLADCMKERWLYIALLQHLALVYAIKLGYKCYHPQIYEIQLIWKCIERQMTSQQVGVSYKWEGTWCQPLPRRHMIW